MAGTEGNRLSRIFRCLLLLAATERPITGVNITLLNRRAAAPPRKIGSTSAVQMSEQDTGILNCLCLLLCDVLSAQILIVSKRLGGGLQTVCSMLSVTFCGSLMEPLVHSGFRKEAYVNSHYGQCALTQRGNPARTLPTEEPPHARSCPAVFELSATG